MTRRVRRPRGRTFLRVPVSAIVAFALLAAVGAAAATAAVHSSRAAPTLARIGPGVQAGVEPVAVAVDPTRHLAWAVSGRGSSMTVISTASGDQVAGTIALPGPALDVAVDPTVGRVYVAVSGGVLAFRESDRHPLPAIPLSLEGFYAEHLAVDPAAGLLIVAGRSSAHFIEVTTSTDAVVPPPPEAAASKLSFTFPGSVVDVAVDPVRHLIYATGGAAYGVFVKSEGGLSEGRVTTLEPALSVAVDPTDGTVWTTTPSSGAVVKIARHAVAGTYQVGGYPEGLAVDGRSGTVYVGDLQGSGVTALDADTGVVTGVNRIGGQLVGLGVDSSNGRVLAVDEGSSLVTVLKGLTVPATVAPPAAPTTAAAGVPGTSSVTPSAPVTATTAAATSVAPPRTTTLPTAATSSPAATSMSPKGSSSSVASPVVTTASPGQP